MTIESLRPRHDAATLLSGLSPLEGGVLHLPGDLGYDAARVPWNLAVDQRPAAVAYPTSPREVSEIVVAAGRAGLRVAAQSTGHNAGPLAARGLDDVVLVRTSAMTGVRIDTDNRTARVEGGTVWLDAVEAAGQHGLAALHGSSPDVGIAGYSLGGGLGWYARQLGLATNSLTAVELVTADGALVRADATSNPELFWALRGGGGSFGVVTALEFALYPITSAYAGMLIWDRRDAEKVLRRWASWSAVAPESVTTSFRILNLPPMPELPEMIRGRQLAVIDGAVLGSDDAGSSIIAGLRELSPEIDTFARTPAPALSRLHMDPEGPTPGVSDASMLAGLDDAGVSAFLTEVGPGSESTLLLAELRQLGGMLSRPHPNGGALNRLDAAYALFGAAIPTTPELAVRGAADAHRLTAALAPWSTKGHYLNFAENPVAARSGYDEQTWRRLKAVRSMVDPDGVFVANHQIPRLYEDGKPSV